MACWRLPCLAPMVFFLTPCRLCTFLVLDIFLFCVLTDPNRIRSDGCRITLRYVSADGITDITSCNKGTRSIRSLPCYTRNRRLWAGIHHERAIIALLVSSSPRKSIMRGNILGTVFKCSTTTRWWNLGVVGRNTPGLIASSRLFG